MLENIVEGLLADPEDTDAALFGEFDIFLRPVELDPDSCALREILHIPFDGGDQTQVECRGPQIGRDASRRVDGAVHQCVECLDVGGDRAARVVWEVRQHHRELHLESGQISADIIMQLTCQTQTFVLSGALLVGRKGGNLLTRRLDGGFTALAEGDVLDQSIPDHTTVDQLARSGTQIDPLDVGPTGYADTPLPVPLEQGSDGFGHGVEQAWTLIFHDQFDEALRLRAQGARRQAEYLEGAFTGITEVTEAFVIADEFEQHARRPARHTGQCRGGASRGHRFARRCKLRLGRKH